MLPAIAVPQQSGGDRDWTQIARRRMLLALSTGFSRLKPAQIAGPQLEAKESSAKAIAHAASDRL